MSKDFDSIYQIEPGKHLYQFYKGADDYFRTMCAFFQAGLEKGQACLWLVSEKKGLVKAQRIAEQTIPKFLYYSCSGQIQIFSADAWYLRNGRFDPAQAESNAKKYMQKILDDGYHCLRGSGDVEVIPHDQWDLLENYEETMHEIIPQMPIIGLCAYPILNCALKETKMVLDHHHGVLLESF